MTARYGFFVDPKALPVISSLCWASCLAVVFSMACIWPQVWRLQV